MVETIIGVEYLNLSALAAPTLPGLHLAARLTALACTWGVKLHPLPEAARCATPQAHLPLYGPFVGAHGDACVIIWHALDMGVADLFLQSLEFAILSQGALSPLFDATSEDPQYRVASPTSSTGVVLLVEDAKPVMQ